MSLVKQPHTRSDTRAIETDSQHFSSRWNTFMTNTV